MAKKSKRDMGFLFLKIAIILFFLVSGINGIRDYSPRQNDNSFQLGDLKISWDDQTNETGTLFLVMAIIELVAAALIILSFFDAVPRKTISVFLLIIFIYWLVRIILSDFVGTDFGHFRLIPWLSVLSPKLIALASLWILYKVED